jgi:hypothetical protein
MIMTARSGSAVQTKGLGLALERLIAAWRSTIERKTPRLSRRLVSAAKKVSTALSDEQEVGVKGNPKRGCRERLLPAPYAGFGQARATRDLHGPAPLGGGQDHLGSGHMLLGGIAITGDRLQAETILRRDADLDPCSHPKSMDRSAPNGNPPNASDH